MVQHVFPKGFKRIRYYGVQATKTFEKVKGLIQEALAKVMSGVGLTFIVLADSGYDNKKIENAIINKHWNFI